MHERNRPKRGFASGPARQCESGRRGYRNAPHRRELHEQVVRMLPVDERPAVQRFAGLEEFPVAVLADGGRIETEHAGDGEVAVGRLPAGHPHPPIGRDDFVAAARTALVVEFREQHAVLHERPARARAHVHLIVLHARMVVSRWSRRVLRPRGTRTGQ